MKLSNMLNIVQGLEAVSFQLPDESFVPKHYHITEIAEIVKRYIDCGGTLRNEQFLQFQLWASDDYDHRLTGKKVFEIIQRSVDALQLKDLDIEIEYQGVKTIEKYGLDFDGQHFLLKKQETTCLAPDACGVNVEKPKLNLAEINTQATSCNPNSGCC